MLSFLSCSSILLSGFALDRYNLLSEESEGYAKVITAMLQFGSASTSIKRLSLQGKEKVLDNGTEALVMTFLQQSLADLNRGHLVC